MFRDEFIWKQLKNSMVVTSQAFQFLCLWLLSVFFVGAVWRAELHEAGIKGQVTLIGRRRISGPSDCLRIVVHGRWGNQMFQILGAAQYAAGRDVRRVFFPKGFGLFQESFEFDVIRFLVDDGRERCTTGKYFYRHQALATLKVELPENFKAAFGKMFNAPGLASDTLVLQMRSGDIFAGVHVETMGQPPCQYYGDAMTRKPWRRVVVVAEDRTGNPCIRFAIDKGASPQIASFRDDMTVLLGAKHLAIGRSSFALSIAFLSYHMNTLYTCTTCRILTYTCLFVRAVSQTTGMLQA